MLEEHTRAYTYQDGPVERRRVWIGDLWKEEEDVCDHEEAQCDDVDHDAISSQRESAHWERFASELLGNDRTNDDKVAREQAGRRQGRHDVESLRRADYDQRDEARESECDVDRIARHAIVVDFA